MQTDEHVPYILVEADLPNGMSPENAISLLEARFKRVKDVYNLSAFALDESCTTVFAVDPCGRSAFALFASAPAKCDANVLDAFELDERIRKHLRNANDALGVPACDRGISPRSWKMEISTILGG